MAKQSAVKKQKNDKAIKNGTERTIDGKECVFYDGYWIRAYHLNDGSFADKKLMIDQLTRRVFHHLEPGINTPSYRLDQIRKIFEAEQDEAKKRVKGAMLAGALLNRGRQILKAIVELEESGVKIEPSNELLRECGRCFMEALSLGKNIKLNDGGEGVDELWGEPFRVFSMPIEDYFHTRYVKVARTMFEIDRVTEDLEKVMQEFDLFEQMRTRLKDLSESAKLACETIRNDPAIFDIWPRYIAAKESYQQDLMTIMQSKTKAEHKDSLNTYRRLLEANRILREGGIVLIKLATLRVPLPTSVGRISEHVEEFLADSQHPNK